jgi:prepilin-type N-terminal cleavage/methylation domain-containing protein
MTNHAQQGYTLIELVVVLAIAGLLVFTTLTGIGTQNATARFGAQVEDIKTAIRGVQTEAASGRGDGIPVDNQIYASGILFSTSNYKIYRLSATTKSWINISTVSLPDGLTLSFSSGWSPTGLAFTVPNERYPSVAAYTKSYSDPSLYDPTNLADRGTVTITVNNAQGHRANITYDTWGGRLSSQIVQ